MKEGGGVAPLGGWLPPGAAARVPTRGPRGGPIPVMTGGGGTEPVGAGGRLFPLPQGLLPPGRVHLSPHPSDARPLVGSGHQGGGVGWCGGWGGEQDPSGGCSVPGRRVGGGVGDGGSAGGGGGGVAPGGVGGDASGWCGGPWGGSGGGHGRG